MRPRILGALLLITATALALGPAAPAQAGPSPTVSAVGNTVSIVGADGADRLTVLVDDVCSETPLCVKVFSNAGAPVAGAGCKLAGATTAYCGLTGTAQLVIGLGDGGDELDLSDQTGHAAGPWTFAVDGGPGDDRLRGPGAPTSGTWQGGAGNDVIVPDANVDGSNVAGRDVVRGGPGKDIVDYSEGPGGVGVRVKLDDRANDGHGSPSDVDDVGKDIEGIIGSPWDDVIKVGSRKVVIDAGAGNDRIKTRNRKKDRVECGSGTDRLKADRADRRKHCERVRIPAR